MSVVSKPAAGTRAPRWLRTAAVLIALTALATGYLVFLRTPAVGTFHDDGIYLVTAKALAEGRGYQIISIPGEPPQTKYPILFPWLLSLVWRLHPSFPANLFWLRLVPLAAMVIWLRLSWALLRRLGASATQAATIVALTAVSPWVALLSTTLMSEMLFAALLTAVMLMITRVCQGDGRRFDALFAGLLAGAAVLTRVAGIAPAAAGFLVLLGSRRSVAAAQYLPGVLVSAIPWFWWARYENPAAMSVDPYYSATNYASWNILTSYAWSEKFDIVAANLFQVGFAPLSVWKVPTPPFPLLALAIAVAGLVVVDRALWRTREQPATLMIVAYCGIHIAWVWPFLRFAVPVAPLFLWFAFAGVDRSRRVGYLGAMTLFALGGFQVGAMVNQAYEKGIVSPFPEDEDWKETAPLLAWVSQNTPTDAVLTGNLDPTYYMFTGRKAIRAFSADPLLLFYDLRGRSENPLGTVDDFQQRLISAKADYLIMTAGTGFAEVPHLNSLVSELSHRCLGSLTPVATNVVPAHVVYRIDRHRLESHDACRRGIGPEVN